MFKKLLIIVTGLIAFGLASALPLIPSAQTGIVLGVQGGYARNNLTYDGKLPVDIDKGNFYGGINAGFDFALASQFSLGAETGVFYGSSLSKVEVANSTFRVSNLIIPALITAKFVSPIGLNLFAKGGAAYLRPSADTSGSGVTVNWDSSWAPAAAVGAGFKFGSFNIYAQYLHIFGKDEVNFGSSTKASNIDAITVGLDTTFSLGI